jgi:hypothetical protein
MPIQTISEIEAGNVAYCDLEFTPSNGVTNVTALSVRVRDAAGVESVASVSSLGTNHFLGSYQTPDTAYGRWYFRWESTAGGVVKGEAPFDVIASKYTSP